MKLTRDVYKDFALLHPESWTPQRALNRPSLHEEVYHGDRIQSGNNQDGDVTQSICHARPCGVGVASPRWAGILPMERKLRRGMWRMGVSASITIHPSSARLLQPYIQIEQTNFQVIFSSGKLHLSDSDLSRYRVARASPHVVLSHPVSMIAGLEVAR